MTVELSVAYVNGCSPFDGATILLEGLDAAPLWNAYRLIASRLLAEPNPVGLVQAADWHWHDGFVTPGESLAQAEWRRWIESPSTLMAAWRAEDYVHRGVFPTNLAWYLRFHLWEDLDHGDFGLDFTGPLDLVRNLTASLNLKGISPVMMDNPLPWFRRSGHTAGG